MTVGMRENKGLFWKNKNQNPIFLSEWYRSKRHLRESVWLCFTGPRGAVLRPAASWCSLRSYSAGLTLLPGPAVTLGTCCWPGLGWARGDSSGPHSTAEWTFWQWLSFGSMIQINVPHNLSILSLVPIGPHCDNSYSSMRLISLTLMCFLSQWILLYVKRVLGQSVPYFL